MERLDKETQKELTEGEKIQELVAGDGWNAAKRMLFERLVNLDSISHLEIGTSATSVVAELRSRKRLIEEVMAWVDTVEGKAESTQDYKERLVDFQSDIIKRLT